MKLYYDKRLKDPTYYAQQGVRNGKKTTTRNVRNFGKHSELLKITDDPIAYVREEIRKMNEEARTGKVTYQLTADFNEKVKSTSDKISSVNWLNIGYFFLQEVMSGLKLKEFFSEKTADRNMSYDCFTISRFLTYSRILDPSSKLACQSRLPAYYEQPVLEYRHILRFLDLLSEHYDEYLSWLFHHSSSIVRRDTSVLYYDCTNYYCECEQEDEDYVDEVTGELLSGLRKYGISKEHRPNPIVEMGLFLDSRGIPLSMCIHPGNTSEQTTAIPSEKDILKMLDGSRFIYCADAGLGSYHIRRFNSMGGRAFIVTQSIKKLPETLKKAVFNDCDFRLLSSDKPMSLSYMQTFDRTDAANRALYDDRIYKVIQADRAVETGLYAEKRCRNGTTKRVKETGMLTQRIIITFSRKVMEYQRTVRSRQIERAKELLKRQDPEEIRKGPNDVRRFLKRITRTQSGETASVRYQLDEEKIAEEARYDGFYAVATNLEDSAGEILAVFQKRYQIEECFRIMKTNFNGRPIYHRLPNRIQAHFLICYTALLVCRLLEVRLEEHGTHVTPTNLIRTLQNLNVANIHDVEYMALYNGSLTLKALSGISDLNLEMLHYRPKELNAKIKKFLK